MNKDDPVRCSVLREKLNAWGVRPNRRMGQNFLVQSAPLDCIVKSLAPEAEDCVYEIGAGAGALTRRLAERAGRVVAIELDRRLASGLKEDLADFDHVKVIQADVLQIDWGSLFREVSPDWNLKVVGNIPYSITGPLLQRLLLKTSGVREIVLMVQKEVAERLLARPGSRQCGVITFLVSYRCRLERIGSVSRNCFWPSPRVDSTLLKFDLLDQPAVIVSSEKHLFSVIRRCFQGRRKMIKNALTNSSGLQYTKTRVIAALERAGIREDVRPEALDLSSYARLSEALQEEESQ